MVRTVHRFQRKNPLVFGLGGKHVLTVVEPVTGGFPQASIHDVGGIYFDVTGSVLTFAHVLEQTAKQTPALRMPEHRTRRLFGEMEQIQLAPYLAVVALFRFL